MSLVKFIIFTALAIFFIYWIIIAIQNYIEASKNVEIAQREYDNTVKYGCPNPTVMQGLAMCPD